MDKLKALQFIESSFIKELLSDSDVTDISYNGAHIFYLHNYRGRQKMKETISEEEAKNFIRQIANLCEKQFSIQTPTLDVSIGRYRINAMHSSIAKRNNEGLINFSIRIASTTPIITEESAFLNAELICLFKILLRSNVSIAIGGITGSGKTEFQKYLISSLPMFSRIIVIDNVLELDNLNIDNLDINIWQSDDRNKEASVQLLVRNALRSNPDWLVVAESRGKEMVEVLNSAMTGHPIITTFHAFDIEGMPKRMARMVMMNEQKQDYEMVLQDIHYNFRFYVYLKREIQGDGKVLRYISEVAEIDEKGTKNTFYSFKKGHKKIGRICESSLERLNYEDDQFFIDTFVKEKRP